MNEIFLMLEDSPNDQKLIQRAIKAAYPAAQIEVYDHLASFYQRIKEGPVPDIVLSDYNLPDGNGLSALLMVKKKFPDVPFVFVTGMLNDEEQVARSILEGASEYILKQNLHRLPERLRKILEVSAAERERNRQKEIAQEEQLRNLNLLEKLLQEATFKNKDQIIRIIQQIKSV
jgi:DNA-binding NtrC family response regulator